MDTSGNTKKITKLSIFDFDGTLVLSPLPDTGRQAYHDKTGTPWPHEGWWGRHESLDLELFDMPTIEEVIAAHTKEMAEASTAVIMLTGRVSKLSKYVEAILEAKGLKFHEHHYNRGGETGDAKMKTMDKLLEKYPDVTHIEMWDDRLAHIPRFEAWGQAYVTSGRLTQFNINLVNGSHH